MGEVLLQVPFDVVECILEDVAGLLLKLADRLITQLLVSGLLKGGSGFFVQRLHHVLLSVVSHSRSVLVPLGSFSSSNSPRKSDRWSISPATASLPAPGLAFSALARTF